MGHNMPKNGGVSRYMPHSGEISDGLRRPTPYKDSSETPSPRLARQCGAMMNTRLTAEGDSARKRKDFNVILSSLLCVLLSSKIACTFRSFDEAISNQAITGIRMPDDDDAFLQDKKTIDVKYLTLTKLKFLYRGIPGNVGLHM